jgi:hypothetical protein
MSRSTAHPMNRKRIHRLKLTSMGDNQRARDMRALRSLAAMLDRSDATNGDTGEAWSDILLRFMGGSYTRQSTRRSHWLAVHFWSRQALDISEPAAQSAAHVAKVWGDAGNKNVKPATIRTNAARSKVKKAALEHIDLIVTRLASEPNGEAIDLDRPSACAAIVDAMQGIAEEYAGRR